MLLAKGLDEEQTPGYSGEAKEGGREVGSWGVGGLNFFFLRRRVVLRKATSLSAALSSVGPA